MASVGGDSIRATDIGSEECFAHACDTCRQDGIEKKADVFCPTCEENLCSHCLEWHKKWKAFKTHEVQPVSSRRSQISSSQDSHGTTMSFATLCTCNQKCEVSEFCKEHQEVICSTCASVKHRVCKISSIDEICMDESVVKTFNLTTEKVGDLTYKASEIKSIHNACFIDLQETEARCKTEIRNIKTGMMNWVETLEKNALADLHTRIEQQKTILQAAGTSAQNALALLKVDQKLLENAKRSQNKRQMFISNIQLEKSLQHYEAALSEAESKLHVTDMEFKKNEKLPAILQESKNLGQVKTREAESKSEKQEETFLSLQASYVTSVDIKQHGDKNIPVLTGAAFLKNGDLLIADRKNLRLTRLDSAFKVKDSTKCTESPWDIAVISEEEVVVTLTNCQTLQFYHVSPKLQATRNIKLDGSGWFWSVTVANDCIYVSRSTPEILVLDKNCNRLRSITPARTGVKFHGLSYIALNRSGNKLFYSDCNSHQLICMATDGKHIYTYTDPDLRSPRGIIVDEDDNVVITGQSSNNIHMVRADGTKHTALLAFSDGIQKPVGIAYYSTTKTLVVGEWDGELKIFNLKRP